MVVVENNNIGFSVLEKLIDAGYPNLYYSTKGTHEFVDQYEAQNISNSIPGFTTSQKTRPLIVSKLEEFIRNDLITIHSARTQQELKTFVWKNEDQSHKEDTTMIWLFHWQSLVGLEIQFLRKIPAIYNIKGHF